MTCDRSGGFLHRGLSLKHIYWLYWKDMHPYIMRDILCSFTGRIGVGTYFIVQLYMCLKSDMGVHISGVKLNIYFFETSPYGFLWILWFTPPRNWPPRYNWNIVESGVKHHKPNLLHTVVFISVIYFSY